MPAPSTVRRIAQRPGRSLERSGLIIRDIENAYLAFDPSEEASIHGLLGHSITYPANRHIPRQSLAAIGDRSKTVVMGHGIARSPTGFRCSLQVPRIGL